MENVNENNDMTKKRIFAAADKLYEACGREAFPTVDAVRREAKAAMGDVSVAMKEWRKAQTAQAVVHEIQAPDVILQAAKVLAVETWKRAQELATESLKSAQAAWDAERTESESMRSEMGKAFDDLAEELDFVKQEKEALDRELEAAHGEHEDFCIKIDSLDKSIESARAKISDQSAHIAAMEAQIKDMQRQSDEAAKALASEVMAKTEAEKQVAVLETTLFVEREKFTSLEKAHKAERDQADIALQAYKDAQAVDRKSLAVADARIAALEDQSRLDRAQIDALHIEVARLTALAIRPQQSPSDGTSDSSTDW